MYISRSVVTLVLLLILSAGPVLAGPNRYMELGRGMYTPYLLNAVEELGELDIARWDWTGVEIGSAETVAAMNRLLEINPRLKFLLRAWPINHLGISDRYAGTATCLDYMLDPGKQAEMDQRMRDAIRLTRANLKNWDSVYGITFLEEIPGWWGCGSEVISHTEPGGPLPADLEHYREAIEKARGKPLVWDHETKMWLGQMYVASLERIHRLLKEETGGKLVFYWHHTNYSTLDAVGDPLPEGFDAVKWPGYPIYFREIIRPGLCDGFMAYPNGREVWENQYMRHVRRHGWLFFSQLSHYSSMRMGAWPETVEMVETKMPQNVGWFFFCGGDCAARGAWNDDQSLPKDPAWHQARTSAVLHQRKLAAEHNVGMDVVKRHLHLRVSLDARIGEPKKGDFVYLVALVENPLDVTYFFPDPTQAIARDVRVTLTLPKGLTANPRHSVGTEVRLGDLPARGRKIIEWWLSVEDPTALRQGRPLVVKATGRNVVEGQAETAKDVAFPAFLTHEIRASGEKWTENGFRYGNVKPIIEMVAVAEPVKNPTLSDGTRTLTYQGEIHAGQRLVITPTGQARLYADNILAGKEEPWKDASDPTGYKAHSEGYTVAAAAVFKYVRPGAKYRATLSGKVAEGSGGLLMLRFGKAGGGNWDAMLFENRLGTEWQTLSQEIELPPEVTVLQRMYLYRYQNKGTVWYGAVALEPADLPAEGLEVSDRLVGQPLLIEPGRLTEFTYTDDSPATTYTKVRVTLRPPVD